MAQLLLVFFCKPRDFSTSAGVAVGAQLEWNKGHPQPLWASHVRPGWSSGSLEYDFKAKKPTQAVAKLRRGWHLGRGNRERAAQHQAGLLRPPADS